MLSSFRKGICLLAASAAFWAGTAQAEEVEVAILDGAFFPEVVTASEGDVLIFVNESEGTQTVVSADEGWRSEDIAIDGTFRLAVEANMSTSFSATAVDGETMSGTIVIN